MAVLDRFYKIRDMGLFPDKFESWDTATAFKFVGAPSWVGGEALPTPDPPYTKSNFNVLPPKGTTGNFTFTVEKYSYPALALLDTGTVTIDVLPFDAPNWETNVCDTAIIVWFNPIGGWSSYMFTGKQTATQEKGDARTFINVDGQKRYSSRDEVYQGVLVTTGKVPPTHATQISSLFKTIQAYLLLPDGSIPILIEPQSFRQVKRGEPYSTYEFEFMRGEMDVVPTQ